MRGGDGTFFRPVTGPTLVRDGLEVVLPRGEHTFWAVRREMFLQVVRDYSGIGDFRDLECYEVEFLFDALRGELKQATKGS